MTNMKAAERAAELANANYGKNLWDAGDFVGGDTGAMERAFVQFIADADAAAREVQSMAKECQFSLGTSMVGKISRTLSPLILPDDVDPLVDVIEIVLSGFESRGHAENYAKEIRAALASRGLEIVEQGK